MAHVLARLRGVRLDDIKEVLRAAASKHADQGLYLERLWQNVDDSNEVLFLFGATDLNRARRFIGIGHAQALKENPKANLPQITFLEEK
jgi:hypothetical protein